MMKIRALNRESSSDEDVPVIRREAQEEIVLELYNKALRLQATGDLNESEIILTKLIDENIPVLENNGGLPKAMSTLKYSCYLNLGHIYFKQDNLNTSLDTYLKASELDGTDVTLWYKIGKICLKVEKFPLAADAFSKGLGRSEAHWPCLDNLITVLYALRDKIGCLEYITKALILDPTYQKGLIIRKAIYTNFPYTRDYYILYNTDHEYEPPLDAEVDEELEKRYLEECEIIFQKQDVIERSLGSQPLQVIHLPKGLEEFTWISLAKTVIYCHQYITDKKMSHFTFFDVSKCMSQNSQNADANNGSPLIVETPEVIEEVVAEVINESPAEQTEVIEEKMEVESIPERRFSQNSETNTNNDGQDNTPVQTDNDDEPQADQEADEQEESELKLDKGKPSRGNKRKRDLLSDLQIWGWHSKRKSAKKGNKDKDFSIEDALNRIIPKHLLNNQISKEVTTGGEESMNTMDLYNMYIGDDDINLISPIHSPQSVNSEPYFGTDREIQDIQQLWNKTRPYVDAIVLVKDFVFSLSKLWHYKWPKELVALYMEAYDMFREHCDPPQVLSEEHEWEDIRNDALATILYGEFLSFSSEGKEPIYVTFISYMQHISGWYNYWNNEYPGFFIRFWWLRAHIFIKEKNYDLAQWCFTLLREVVVEEEEKASERYFLSLPNCYRCGVVTNQIIEKLLKHLEMINSLGKVEKLYHSENFVEVANIIKSTFDCVGGKNIQVGKIARPAQLGFFIFSLFILNKEECFIWLEECLHEALENFFKPNKLHDKWELLLEKCLNMLYEVIKLETVIVVDCLEDNKRSRLVESLCKIICKQINSEASKLCLGSVTPWILLHYILQREEHRKQASIKVSHVKRDKNENSIEEVLPQIKEHHEEELPASVAILFSAHEFLGPKGLCLTGQGELLHFILDHILDKLDSPLFEPVREKMDIPIEQAFFCLYQYPTKTNKISRHLADHNVDPLSLTWERAFQLFEFYIPDSLPEFNSYKNASISADLEQLLKRIIALVPSECDPKNILPKITEYLNGKTEKLPDPIVFPYKVRSIYYLIGDYYFKQREFVRSMKYFQMDLCINPERLDSWACLGLCYSSQLDNKLNYCKKIKSESEFLDIAKCAQICFRKALSLAPNHLMLWIECGSFEYMVHSYCSRLLKYESENFSMEKFEFLEGQKESFLDSSGTSLEKAIALYEDNDENETDERWLQYYIIGKIAEKKQKEPTDYLQYYITASTLLHENNANYPEKINYNNPQHLAVEALELHYRLNASVLKYLELHEGKEIPNTLGSFFKKCLAISQFSKKPVVKPPEKVVESPGTVTTTSFQDQFLNSLKDSDTDITTTTEMNALIRDADTINGDVNNKKILDEVKNCLDDVLLKVEELEKKEVSIEKKQIEENVIAEEKQEEQLCKNEIQEIIVLSDSDDEPNNSVAKEQKSTELKVGEEITVFEKNITEQDKIVKEHPVEVKDVQQVLDALMKETMLKTESEVAEVDSDVSFTEEKKHILEDVEMKDLSIGEPDNKKDIQIESQLDTASETKKTVVETCMPVEKQIDTKHKPTDSETETENIRTSMEDDSTSSSSSSSCSSSSSDSESDDDSSSSNSSSSTENPNMSNSEILQLVDRCISGLEICITRLPQNYKALYRLSHVYFNYKGKKDLTKAKQLLLGEYKCKSGTTVTGLFSDRKTNNFFNGIWRIPSTEIDRPGSLAAHMNRCVSLLLQVLQKTNDNKTLMELCMQLRRTPDPDKIYIKDSDRMAFSEQAITMCTQSLRSQMKNMSNLANPLIVKLLQDTYRAYQKVQKHIPSKEAQFANMLMDIYKNFIKEKIPDNVNILDLAIKFCQQNKPVEKIRQVQSLSSLSRSPGVASPPVLPSPNTVGQTAAPLKRPGAGRPRGRPPLPKIPGQTRSPRAKTPTVSSNYSSPSFNYPSLLDQNLAMEYLKQYQEQLIKQYSQNLTLPQLQQVTQLVLQGQSPLGVAALANQYMAGQSSLLSPSSLIKKINATSGPSLSMNVMDSLNQLNPSLKKKITSEINTSGYLSSGISNIQDKMKYMGSMLPSRNSISPHSTIPSKLKSSSKPNVKFSTADSGKIKTSASMKPNLSSQVFKEPQVTKSIVTQPVESSNMFLKERPNISITPVTTAHTPFVPHVSAVPGKTLQEKLADKQKQHSSKAQAKKVESEVYHKDLPISPASNLMKSLNLPNIPASLSVSKAVPTTHGLPSSLISQPSVPPVPQFSKDKGLPVSMTMASASISTKYQDTKIPASLSVTKTTLPSQPIRFPSDSGISISQVSMTSRKKKESLLNKKFKDPAFSHSSKSSFQLYKTAASDLLSKKTGSSQQPSKIHKKNYDFPMFQQNLPGAQKRSSPLLFKSGTSKNVQTTRNKEATNISSEVQLLSVRKDLHSSIPKAPSKPSSSLIKQSQADIIGKHISATLTKLDPRKVEKSLPNKQDKSSSDDDVIIVE